MSQFSDPQSIGLIKEIKTGYPYIRVLSLAAVIDWLITRTVTRAAIHMPKSEAMVFVYRIMSSFGQLAGTFVALLAVVILTGIAWYEWKNRRAFSFSLLLIIRVTASLVFLVFAPVGWIAVGNHLLTLVILLLVVIPEPEPGSPRGIWMAFALRLPALALLAGLLYQLLPSFFTALALPGPAPLAGWFFNAGELLVVLSVYGLWWAHGRVRAVRIWVLAALPALVFTLAFLRDPAMTGILAIWSTGLSLYLPWPMYALALWLMGVTVLATRKSYPQVADALLLLTASGYAPQLSPQLFSALIALCMLARSRPVPGPVTGRSQRKDVDLAPGRA